MSIEVDSLSKNFHRQKALNQISFKAKPGQILGFLGPNGDGKSTTMKIATGYILPDEGDVLVKGVSVVKHPKVVSKMVGYLPEHNPLYLDMYPTEFLSFIGGLYKLEGKKLVSRISIVMDQCGLMKERKKKIGQMSKGFRQRVGLAKALLHDPEIIILDEPTSGLDPNQLVEIRKLIKDISKDKTLILSTHIMQEVEAICEKVVIIHNGTIVAQDLLQNLKSHKGQYSLNLETEEPLQRGWFSEIGVAQLSVIHQKSFLFLTDDPSQLRRKLLKVVQEKNLNLVSLKQQEKDLESIFHKLTQS